MWNVNVILQRSCVSLLFVDILSILDIICLFLPRFSWCPMALHLSFLPSLFMQTPGSGEVHCCADITHLLKMAVFMQILQSIVALGTAGGASLYICWDRSYPSLCSPVSWRRPRSWSRGRIFWPRSSSSCRGGRVLEPDTFYHWYSMNIVSMKINWTLINAVLELLTVSEYHFICSRYASCINYTDKVSNSFRDMINKRTKFKLLLVS